MMYICIYYILYHVYIFIYMIVLIFIEFYRIKIIFDVFYKIEIHKIIITVVLFIIFFKGRLLKLNLNKNLKIKLGYISIVLCSLKKEKKNKN